jgi:hypothetical protein
MPLYKRAFLEASGPLLKSSFKVTRSYAELVGQVVLNDSNRVARRNESEMHQRAFLVFTSYCETGIPI